MALRVTITDENTSDLAPLYTTILRISREEELGWSNLQGVSVRACHLPSPALTPCPLSHKGRGGFPTGEYKGSSQAPSL